ncbi:glycosyltransferase [Phocaeicola plebeius]|uniref:glycosyltransferase n=1 Tax=Phocaeicola plebeius TaxID=310297 RepID=UPI0026F29115|nr:glycosyltransferase [Phocaeicola plebeius]MCI6051412.1 glycosyltransferase [Phocaeicola plebeius]MDD6913368.1 glycosyltransferase [Phocaeicola plebeius]MDY5978011.1 glycosyltransferase [Phocaeicola plebeius]
MLSILINAYACSPEMGSEPGMGWNWCVNLAKHCELHIITEGEFRDNIEAALPNLPQRNNMHFYYNPVSEKIRKMCWNQGDWRFYKYYREWQWKTYLIAKKIIQKHHIDVIHQLNMIGFREPGYLWKIKNIPFIWGPIDAKESFPTTFLKDASFKTKLFISLKNAITKYQLKYAKRVHLAAKQATYVISASSNSQQAIRKYFHIESPLLNETGCYIQDHPIIDKSKKEDFDILWVGKLDFRKQLNIALCSIARAQNRHFKLHIVGGGNNSFYQMLAKKLGIEKQCIWYGSISHKQVQKFMQKSDIFFFTSIAEGTPHVVLEAIGNNLPVLCFNTCGQGDCVNENIGIKIELSNPEQSIQEFSSILNDLEKKRCSLQMMSEKCKQRQIELSWTEKALQMLNLYNNSIRKT